MEEIWKDIEGYEGFYQVSNLGRIKSLERKIKYPNGHFKKRKEIILSGGLFTSGYYGVILHKNGVKKTKTIHKAVAECFCKKTSGKNDINHINGIKTDNRSVNLEWCTKSENSIHSYKLGLQSKKGSKHHLAKLNEEIVKIIKKDYSKMKLKEVAKIFNVSSQTICDIRKNRHWKHI